MLRAYYTNKIKKDIKLIKKRGYDLKKFEDVVGTLMEGKCLDEKYRDHALMGDYSNCRECHIEPDWLLIYKIENHTLTLVLFRTGTHGDLFG